MKPSILFEVQEFLKRWSMPASRLAGLAGVPGPVLTRLLSGARRDVRSLTADALRLAMHNYEATHDANRQYSETP